MGVGNGSIWGDFGAKVGVFVCHSVGGLQSIEADGCPEAGVFVCHSVVGLQTIKADGCPEAGVFVCHSVVGLLVIEADDSCPGAGVFRCHSVVDLGFIGLSPGAYSDVFAIAFHRVVGILVGAIGSLGWCCSFNSIFVFVQIKLSNSKEGCARCCRYSGGDFRGPSRSKGSEG